MEKKDKIKLVLSVLVIVLSGIFIVYQVRGATVNLGVDLDLGGVYRIRNAQDPAADSDLATYGSVKTLVRGLASGNYVIKWDNTADNKLVPSNILDNGSQVQVSGVPINAAGGLIIQTVGGGGTQPSTVGSIWMCTDNDGTPYDCLNN